MSAPQPGPAAVAALACLSFLACATARRQAAAHPPPAAAVAPSPAPREAPAQADPAAGEFEDFEAAPAAGTPRAAAARTRASDPLIGYNRLMYQFNDKFFLYAWKPLAKGYGFLLPEPVRVSIDRAFLNFRFPARFGNSLLQLRLRKAGVELGRFLVNSTLGLAGFFDPADRWVGLKAPDGEDFGQTLGRYGVGEGIPLVLPFLGPSNLRDGVGRIADIFMSPLTYFASAVDSTGVTAGETFNSSSLHLEEYESLQKDALDPYSFLRDAYEQNRENRIKE